MVLSKLIFFLIFLLLGCPMPVHAKAIPVTLTLHSIEAIKTVEKRGDEIYFDITQYSSLKAGQTLRVPEAPLHWKSSQLPQVHDVVLWQGRLEDKEEIKLFVSLVEQDNPPFDVDDLIGTALVLLHNENGKLKYQFDLPVFEERIDQTLVPGKNPREYLMKGDHSNYKIVLKVDEGK